jgi:hypothetical protein
MTISAIVACHWHWCYGDSDTWRQSMCRVRRTGTEACLEGEVKSCFLKGRFPTCLSEPRALTDGREQVT